MCPNHAIWIALFIIAISGTLAAKYYAYFPGDVAVERWAQSLLPPNLSWAEGFSRTAELPWVLLILGIVFAISWALAGWRAAFISVLSLGGMFALGCWLGAVIARPRPSPELVHVYRPLSGYSFPSQFALRYAATFGFLAILAAWKSSGTPRTSLLIVCSGLLILGWFARLALAAHWPSDVILSYYLGFYGLLSSFVLLLGHSYSNPK